MQCAISDRAGSEPKNSVACHSIFNTGCS